MVFQTMPQFVIQLLILTNVIWEGRMKGYEMTLLVSVCASFVFLILHLIRLKLESGAVAEDFVSYGIICLTVGFDILCVLVVCFCVCMCVWLCLVKKIKITQKLKNK